MLKKLTCIFTAIAAAVMTAQAMPDITAYAADSKVILTLYTGEDYASSNFYTLRDALLSADGSGTLTIKLAGSGKYYVGTTGQALRIESNTTLDLNGATLVRSGAMLNQNLFQNADNNDDRDAGGYSLSKNITIKNGTLDGNAASSSSSVNMLNFGHAENITLDSLTIKNVLEGHLVEFSGCKDVTVSGCTFDGYYGTATGVNEAIQLDISKTSWNGVYKSDNTVCKNVTITGCTFNNFPSGVGNHHTLTGGCHNTNINIVNNKFLNTKKFAELGAAVWCYGFDSSTVKGNTIKGYYSDGIKVSGGSVDVLDNTISTLDVADSSGIYVTHSSSHIYTNDPPSSRTEEYVKSGDIKGNTVTNYGRNGISVNSSSVLGTVSSNTVTGGKGSGIFITRSTVKNSVNSNTITGCKYYDADNLGHGIHVTSTATVNEISGNKITSCAGYGFVDYSTLIAVSVSSNTLSSNKLGTYVVNSEAPAKVTNFKASENTQSSVKLSWSKVSGAEGYVLYRYDTSSKSYKRIAKQAANSYVDKKLAAGTNYKYAVRAYKTVAGKEVLSGSYPTLTTYTVMKLTAAANGVNSIRLSWSKISGASGYIVYRYDSTLNSGKGGWKILGRPTSNTFTDTGLKAGTSYKYAVKSFTKSSGKEVVSTNKYPTLTTSTKPAKVSFTAKSSAAKKITFSWSKVTGATNYIVYYRVKGTSKWSSVKVANTVTAKTITGLVSGKTYEATVKAVRTASSVTYNAAYDVKTVKVK